MKNKLTKIILMGILVLGGATLANAAPKAPSKKPMAAQQQISSERAKQIALNHARVSEGSVRKMKVERDTENGKAVYEVDFETVNGHDYDYTIDARTGAIIEFDQD